MIPGDGTTPAGGRSLVVDERLPSRLARGFLRWQLTRPSWIVLLSLTALVVAAGTVLTVMGHETAAWLALVLVVIVSGTVTLWFVAVRSAIQRAYPVGSVASAAVSDDRLVSASALGSSEIRFSAFRGVDVAGDALVLKVGSWASGVAVMPRALLSEADVDRLQIAVHR